MLYLEEKIICKQQSKLSWVSTATTNTSTTITTTTTNTTTTTTTYLCYYYYYYWHCLNKIKTAPNKSKLNKAKETTLQAKQKPVIAKLFDFIYLILT